MSRLNYLLCAVVVLLVAIETTAGHGHGYGRGHGHGRGGNRHQHQQHGSHHYNRVQISFTVFDPKGFEAYVTRPNDSVQNVAIEMTINGQGSPKISLTTNQDVYGKFILRDNEAVIRPGDSLNIAWTMQLVDGSVSSGNQVQQIDQNMIQKNCTCEAGSSSRNSEVPQSTTAPTTTAPATTAPATTTGTSTSSYQPNELGGTDFEESDNDASTNQLDCDIDPSTNLCRESLFDERFDGESEKLIDNVDEVRALKGIIDSLLNQPCREQQRSTLLKLTRPPSSVDSSIDLLTYVRRNLGEEPKLKRLASSAIRSAEQSGDVIVFEMKTQLDKLMMLYLCKEIGLTAVADLD